ncbi:hypothetical protein [Spirillospora sp. NBC_01491]|uniref:hypothetical protein n=1 Tax=Spirillospora sp. NBC_01491 TaxID=2976007 RepID=UPI002E340156|nr:hypothetical protein [Spirillospora sp. NBC_01491]
MGAVEVVGLGAGLDGFGTAETEGTGRADGVHVGLGDGTGAFEGTGAFDGTGAFVTAPRAAIGSTLGEVAAEADIQIPAARTPVPPTPASARTSPRRGRPLSIMLLLGGR